MPIVCVCDSHFGQQYNVTIKLTRDQKDYKKIWEKNARSERIYMDNEGRQRCLARATQQGLSLRLYNTYRPTCEHVTLGKQR